MTNIAVIVDLETEGLDSNEHQIIEIGAIKIDLQTGEVLDQFQTFSLPEVYYEYDEDDEEYDEEEARCYDKYELDIEIQILTGITSEMLLGAPYNQEAVDSFFKFAENYPIWAYSAGFDSKFLNIYTKEFRPLRDILTVARRAFPNLPNHKLVTVADYLNISTEGSHRAIADCLMAKEVLVQGLKIYADHPELLPHHFKVSDYKANENAMFFGKTIVFTGALTTMKREVAAKHASKYGFKIGAAVSKTTDYLVVGIQDLSNLAGHEKSTKHRTADELIESGLDIKIITENDFLEIIKV